MCYSSCVSILIHCHLPLTCQIFSWISSFVRVQFHIQTKLWNNHYLIFYEDCVVESEIYLQMREDTAAIWLHVLCFHIQHRFLWKLFGRSIWIWLIDNWSVCKLVRPEPTITSCEQVCVREGSRLLHFIRQILSVPLPGCLLLKAEFNRKIKRACFIWHFIHQRPGGWGGWGGKSSAMMIQSLSVMFSRLPFPSFLLTGFHTTCLILSHRMLTISQLQKSFHSLFQRPQWAKEFQFIISR